MNRNIKHDFGKVWLLVLATFMCSAAWAQQPATQTPTPPPAQAQPPITGQPTMPTIDRNQLPDNPVPERTEPPQASAPQTATPRLQPAPTQSFGTAAAEANRPVGIAASRPAGAAIAPPKQRQVRSFLIKMGVVAGAGVALGTVVALSEASPARVPNTAGR